jgi:hypothetical protein
MDTDTGRERGRDIDRYGNRDVKDGTRKWMGIRDETETGKEQG